MGNVYRARQQSVNREVAVKVIQPSQSDPSLIAKFEQESRLIASLSHPHIIKVFGFGVVRGFHLKLIDPQADARQDLVYFAMELFSGGTLDDLLARGPLPLQQTRLFMRQMAEALDYAHQKGVTHCDLKPANILLDETNNAFLCDFGIAILNNERPKEGQGKIRGTPFYMAPEQWKGELTGSWTDTYALGIILWEMLTGQPPYTGETVAELFRAHTLDPIPNILDFRPELPLAVQTVFEKALAKDRTQRYQFAGQLIVNLDQALGVKRSRIVSTTRKLEVTPNASEKQVVEVVRDLRPAILGAALAGVGIIFLIVALLVFMRTADNHSVINSSQERGSVIGTLGAGTATARALDATNRAVLATLSPNGDLQATIQTYSATLSR
jgi:serine/threonine-protein kinase